MNGGAVTYLAHSIFGRNRTEISTNNWGPKELLAGDGDYYISTENSSKFLAHSGYSVGDLISAEINEGDVTTTNYYNTEQGVLSSTTGNIYGVYDLVGGVDEYISSYAEDLRWPGNSIHTATIDCIDMYGSYLKSDSNSKIKGIFTIDLSSMNGDNRPTSINHLNTHKYVFGDAMWETSNLSNTWQDSWNGDYSSYPSCWLAFVTRGGNYNAMYTSSVGLFNYAHIDGGITQNRGFRACVVSPD